MAITRFRGRRKRLPWRFLGTVVAVWASAFAGTLLWSPGAEKAGADAPTAPAADRFVCEVAYVNDGDTFRCADGVRVRLHAVAARENDETCSPGHPCPAASAASAKAQLERLVAGETISCERTGKSYNRITAICWTPGDVEVNCAMIRSGTTVVWPRFNDERRICE